LKAALKTVLPAARLSKRVAELGHDISRDFAGRTVDLVVVLENSFVFAADLMRQISRPVVCHFVRVDVRDVKQAGHDRREIFFSQPPQLRGRDVLLVDALLNTGITQDFLCRRLLEARPRSLRLAVLVDKRDDRRVDVKPDYFGFSVASKYVAGYGLAGSRGWYRNLPYIGVRPSKGRGVVRRGQVRKVR
jgi:hypoxanthine phosphoribosyltransferase